jgi:imidazole glycerol phosphate synthase glutamine amidotransferase subunit
MEILSKTELAILLKKIFIISARILTMKKVKIVDFSISSIGSIHSALKRTSANNIEVVQDLNGLEADELLVIPGNGNFGKASKALDEKNLRLDIIDFIDNGGKILGICLGMQILASSSEESVDGVGLNYFNTKVKKFPSERNIRIPHIGWAQVKASSNPFNFKSLNEPADFYFSHSYFIEDASNIATKLISNNDSFNFCCGLMDENIIAVQFHPEKSSRIGARFLDDVVAWANE